MAPKHLLMLHRVHNFINAQPRFTTTIVSFRVEHVDRIVPTAWGLAMVVKHPTKLVVRRLRYLGTRCHDFWTDQPQGILSLGRDEGNKEENRTQWDFELRCELDRISDFNYAIRGSITQKALKMEDENGGKCLYLQSLARLD